MTVFAPKLIEPVDERISVSPLKVTVVGVIPSPKVTPPE